MADDRHKQYKASQKAAARARRRDAAGRDVDLTPFETFLTWVPQQGLYSDLVQPVKVAAVVSVAGAVWGLVAAGPVMAILLAVAGIFLVGALTHGKNRAVIVGRVRRSLGPDPEFDRRGRRIRAATTGPSVAGSGPAPKSELIPEHGSSEHFLKKINEKLD